MKLLFVSIFLLSYSFSAFSEGYDCKFDRAKTKKALLAFITKEIRESSTTLLLDPPKDLKLDLEVTPSIDDNGVYITTQKARGSFVGINDKKFNIKLHEVTFYLKKVAEYRNYRDVNNSLAFDSCGLVLSLDNYYSNLISFSESSDNVVFKKSYLGEWPLGESEIEYSLKLCGTKEKNAGYREEFSRMLKEGLVNSRWISEDGGFDNPENINFKYEIQEMGGRRLYKFSNITGTIRRVKDNATFMIKSRPESFLFTIRDVEFYWGGSVFCKLQRLKERPQFIYLVPAERNISEQYSAPVNVIDLP